MRLDPAEAAAAARRALARAPLHLVPCPYPEGIAEALASIPPEDVPAVRMRGPASGAAEALASRLSGSRFPDALRRALVEDVGLLCSLAARTGRRGEVAVRFEAVTDDGCRLFHRDGVPLRLATTYLGPGTEYLDPREEDAPESSRIRAIPTGAVALFKGGEAGLVHRSPPIAGSGRHRVFLSVDPA